MIVRIVSWEEIPKGDKHKKKKKKISGEQTSTQAVSLTSDIDYN